jgi:acyl-CoA dehydrogenase
MTDRSYLAWPFFDDRHRTIADRLQAYAPGLEALAHEERDVEATCRALVRRLGGDGWLKLCVPAAYGGAFDDIDARALCLAREHLAYAAGLADFAFAMQGLGSGAISLFGDEAIKRAWLPGVAAGETICAFALSEPEAGSDAAAIAATARRDGGAYVIDGTKTWISNGGLADLYTVFARTGGPGPRGISAFVVPGDTPGLTVVERIALIAPHPLATLRFDGVRVPASALIGAEGEGFKVAMATLDLFRTSVGAAALGFARRALDEALARAATRKLFGGVLADLQLVQGRIAEMATAVDAAALMVYRGAWTKDIIGGRTTREAAMAKLQATELAQEVIDAAVQIMGGHGVVSGNPVERLYREIRALRIYEGASEVQKVIIAGQVLKGFDARA